MIAVFPFALDGVFTGVPVGRVAVVLGVIAVAAMTVAGPVR